MKTHKTIRSICNVGISILLPCFIFGVIWFLTGSLELEPTAEQMEKARMAALVFMMLTGIPCAVCIFFRIKFRKRK